MVKYAIDFKCKNPVFNMEETDTLEISNSFEEFKMWLSDNDIVEYEIINIRLY